MKYAVTEGNVKTEFATYAEAEQYAIGKGVSTGSISEVDSDPIYAPETSSLEYFGERLAEGYPVPGTPYRLAMQDSDRAQFSSMLVLIRELMDAGYITNDTPHEIKAIDNQIFQLTTAQFRQTMIGYGIHYKNLWNQCAPTL